MALQNKEVSENHPIQKMSPQANDYYNHLADKISDLACAEMEAWKDTVKDDEIVAVTVMAIHDNAGALVQALKEMYEQELKVKL